jgi:transposase
VQYGPRIAAVIVCLYIGQFLPKKQTAQALAELFGIPQSPGTVAELTARAAGTLDGFLRRVRGHITASQVAGFDETGFRVAGTLHWVHRARTGKYTPLKATTRRADIFIDLKDDPRENGPTLMLGLWRGVPSSRQQCRSCGGFDTWPRWSVGRSGR